MALDRLYLCQTCVRDKPLAPVEPSLGRQLSDNISQLLNDDKRLASGLVLRRVSCLSGCLSPCNIAFRGEGKFNLRFSRLSPDDAGHVLDFAVLYKADALGDVARQHWPETLKDKLTVRTPPPAILLAKKSAS